MDTQKQLSTMDPKLKEAYDRVMANTHVPTPIQSRPTPSQSGSTPPPTPAPTVTQTTPPVETTTTSPAVPPKPVLQTIEVHDVPPTQQVPDLPQTPHAVPLGNPDQPSATPQSSVVSENVVITTPHPQATMYTAQPPTPTTPHPTGTGTVHIGYGTKPGGLNHQKVTIEKKKLNIPPALYIAGCIVFFILYTFFWIKVFNISLPFLP